jgi:hypothetical protein
VLAGSLYGRVTNRIRIDKQQMDVGSSPVPCFLNNNNSSTVAFIASFMLISMFASVFSIFLKYSMVILTARSDEQLSHQRHLNKLIGATSTYEPVSKGCCMTRTNPRIADEVALREF